jgi:hypothetical protein
MIWSIIIYGILTAVFIGMPVLVIHYTTQFNKLLDTFDRPWLWKWMFRGLAFPLAIWVMMNLGSMPLMPPLTRGIARLRNSGSPGMALFGQIALALFFILSNWAMVTFFWMLAILTRRAKNPEEMVMAAIFWSPILLPVLGLLVGLFGWGFFGFGMLLWIWPLSEYCINNADFRKPSPAYGKVVAKIARGRYSDAEMAILGELEHSENDFEGWMRLSELYANQFHDIASADQAIHDLCLEPATTLSQISVALHKLADWHINIYGNVAAARRTLEELCARMPGTHLATMARHRINTLPAADRIEKSTEAPRLTMQPAMKDFGETLPPDVAVMDEQTALDHVNQCVEKLNVDPNNVAARERLAVIYASHLGQVDLAVEQLQLLLEMPDQPSAKSARWLGLMAGWLTQHRGEGDAVRNILEKLVREHPQSPQAFEAQRRLGMIKEAERVQRASARALRQPKSDEDETPTN